MISIGKWRWPVIVALPLIVGGLLVWRGQVHMIYEGQAVLTYAGSAKQVDAEMALFRSMPSEGVTLEKVPGKPLEVALRVQASKPEEVVRTLTTVGQSYIQRSLAKEVEKAKKNTEPWQMRAQELSARYKQLEQSRQSRATTPRRRSAPRADISAQIESLKSRRRMLIDRYPTHTDIPLLAKQIQDLTASMAKPTAPTPEATADLARLLNETYLRRDYFSRQVKEYQRIQEAVKPDWRLVSPVQAPKRPIRVQGWPLGTAGVVGAFVLGIVLFKGKRKPSGAVSNGLWKPEPAAVATPVELQVVSPEPAASDTTAVAPVAEAELPSDPLTEKAAALYGKWVEVAKILYQPAAEAPQGVLDQVGPLMQESNDFLQKGHDALARYLARAVTPGDLPAHVARTVLMTLTGAQEAGVSPEHCLAMALAALFHDLAVVPRPAGMQDNVGSEVGRLSATVLRRIPGLQPAILSMVEDILIGMDEFKLDTWQNGAKDNTLEPLSKVLREIDRFEKVMQKQKSRLERRVANQ